MKLLLVRHGQTYENAMRIMQGHLPGELTELGIEQAEKLRDRLKDEKIDAIYSSDLKRAHDTANIIAAPHNIDVVTSVILRERCYGDLTGQNRDVLIKMIEESGISEVEFKPGEHAENYYDVKDRAKDFIQLLLQKHSDDTVLVVAHGGFNRTFLSAALNTPLTEMFSYGQPNTCLNILEFEEGDYAREILIGCTAHLTS